MHHSHTVQSDNAIDRIIDVSGYDEALNLFARMTDAVSSDLVDE